MRLTRAEIQWIPYIMQLYYVSLLSIYIGQRCGRKEHHLLFSPDVEATSDQKRMDGTKARRVC